MSTTTDSHKERRYTCIFGILGKPHEVKLCIHCMRNLNAIKMIYTHAHTHAYVQHNCHTKTHLDALTSLYTSLCCRQECMVGNGDVHFLMYWLVVHVIQHIRVTLGCEGYAHHLCVPCKVNSLRRKVEHINYKTSKKSCQHFSFSLYLCSGMGELLLWPPLPSFEVRKQQRFTNCTSLSLACSLTDSQK